MGGHYIEENDMHAANSFHVKECLRVKLENLQLTSNSKQLNKDSQHPLGELHGAIFHTGIKNNIYYYPFKHVLLTLSPTF